MTSPPASSPAVIPTGRLAAAGYLLGFALGGFFDGILLHQVLQWHHLLSALENQGFGDVRMQILADGLFHVLMYLIAAFGLWLLWRSRRSLADGGAERPLLAAGLIGFGLWHVLDAILSHWLLGIHRIRMDSAVPLAWDIGWLAVFGILPLLAGLVLPPGGGGHGRRRRLPVATGLTLLVLAAAPLAALPPADNGKVMVLFGPGLTTDAAFAALADAQARPIWSDPSGQVWAVQMEVGASPLTLYRRGALLVGSGLLAGGCLNWASA